MPKKPLFWEMFTLIVIVGALNYIAIIYHLYWSANEFDSLVHFFGGAALSAFFLWLYFFSGLFDPPKRNLTKFLLVSVLGTIIIAVSWETYELLLGEAMINKAEYPFDTTLDLIMALLGALAACFYAYLREGNNSHLS